MSSADVVRAYIERVREVEPLLNSVVDDRFKEALEEAQAADALVRSGGSTEEELERLKPLLGVPFISKNSVAIKGMVMDVGVPAWRGQRAEHDSETVSLLRQAGAIPVALTNTPQLCLWTESFNKVHGRTNNPHDTRRTCGGSSGTYGFGFLLLLQQRKGKDRHDSFPTITIMPAHNLRRFILRGRIYSRASSI